MDFKEALSQSLQGQDTVDDRLSYQTWIQSVKYTFTTSQTELRKTISSNLLTKKELNLESKLRKN